MVQSSSWAEVSSASVAAASSASDETAAVSGWVMSAGAAASLMGPLRPSRSRCAASSSRDGAITAFSAAKDTNAATATKADASINIKAIEFFAFIE